MVGLERRKPARLTFNLLPKSFHRGQFSDKVSTYISSPNSIGAVLSFVKLINTCRTACCVSSMPETMTSKAGVPRTK